MEILQDIFVLPFVDMAEAPEFFAEVVIGGLMAGIMYSLVALGFVLIFKASGVFNFAQGVLALFAALTLVALMTGTVPVVLTQVPGVAMPPWLAIIITIVVMIGMALRNPLAILFAAIALGGGFVVVCAAISSMTGVLFAGTPGLVGLVTVTICAEIGQVVGRK